MITSSTFLPTPLNFRKSLGLHNRAYLMFRHGCTTVSFNWILIRQRSFSLLLNKPEKPVSPFLCRPEWNLDSSFFSCPQLDRHPRPKSFFSSTSPAPVKSAILNCVESIISVTTCHKMLSRHWSLLLSRQESITAILYSLVVIVAHSQTAKSSERRCKQGLFDEILSLITYLPSFTLFTGFLLNKELNINCFSLTSNL